MVNLGMDWKLSSLAIEWRWNHHDPTVGLPRISSESRKQPFGRFAPPLATPSLLSSLSLMSTSRRLPELLSRLVRRFDIGRGFNGKSQWLSQKGKRKKKKRGRRRRYHVEGERRRMCWPIGEVGSLVSDRPAHNLKKFGKKITEIPLKCPKKNSKKKKKNLKCLGFHKNKLYLEAKNCYKVVMRIYKFTCRFYCL